MIIENRLIIKENKELKEKLNKGVVVTSEREERLSKEIYDLRSKNKEYKQQINILKGIDEEKSLRINNHVSVKTSDYVVPPPIQLIDILNKGYRIVLFGFTEGHSTYQYFSKYHKDFCMKPGFGENYDAKDLRAYDFIFEYIDEIAHKITKKNKITRPHIPYAKLEKHDSETMLENAMANILVRHFKLA